MRIIVYLLLATALAAGQETVLREAFATDPAGGGWQRHGETGLFRWEAADEALAVTWNSSRPNSYFYRPLGRELTRADDFSLEFTLRLEEVAVGVDPSKPFTFQIAVALMNWAEAVRPDFFRGTGKDAVRGARSLVEWDYFPDSGYGATVAPTVVSGDNLFAYGHTFPLEVETGPTYEVRMRFSSGEGLLRTEMTRNGAPFGLPPDNLIETVVVPEGFEFELDTVAVASYSDGWADGSVRAAGMIDDLTVRMPQLPVEQLRGGWNESGWQVGFLSRSDWSYVLERTTNFLEWESVTPPQAGTGEWMALSDGGAGGAGWGFYRVEAIRP